MSSRSPVEVAIALLWREGRLLITRRRAETHLGGLWEFPGGKCEPGESPQACAEREVLEEVGLRCQALRTRAPIEYVYPGRTVRLHPVDCDCAEGTPVARQVEEWAWVRPDELHRYPFPPANAGLLEALAAGERGR